VCPPKKVPLREIRLDPVRRFTAGADAGILTARVLRPGEDGHRTEGVADGCNPVRVDHPGKEHFPWSAKGSRTWVSTNERSPGWPMFVDMLAPPGAAMFERGKVGATTTNPAAGPLLETMVHRSVRSNRDRAPKDDERERLARASQAEHPRRAQRSAAPNCRVEDKSRKRPVRSCRGVAVCRSAAAVVDEGQGLRADAVRTWSTGSFSSFCRFRRGRARRSRRSGCSRACRALTTTRPRVRRAAVVRPTGRRRSRVMFTVDLLPSRHRSRSVQCQRVGQLT